MHDFRLPRPTLSLFLPLMIGAFNGCSDDPPVIRGGAPMVLVQEERTLGPAAGVKVAVLSKEGNIPVALATSDDSGRCFFPELSYGEYRLMAFGGNAWEAHEVPAAWYWWGKSAALDHGPRPEPAVPTRAKTPPAPLPPKIFMRPVNGDPLPRIAGQVVDTQSGLPLKDAFLSLSPFPEGFQGDTAPSDDVTGIDGSFTVNRVPFFMDPVSGNLTQLTPLRVTRHGYRPALWTYLPPSGSQDLDIAGVTIGLEPLTADDTGVLRGRLVRPGQMPAVGVLVGLGIAGVPDGDKAGAGLTGWTAESDSNGSYEFTGLPAGSYLLHPGYLPLDGNFYPNQPGNIPWSVTDGEITGAADLTVLHEIVPVSPWNGSRWPGPPERLIWSVVPDAVRYRIHLDAAVLGSVAGTSLFLPDSLEIAEGLHTWGVTAFDGDGTPVGSVQKDAVFRVGPL